MVADAPLGGCVDAADRRVVARRREAGPAHVVVRGAVGCLRDPVGERLDGKGGVVAGDTWRVVPPAVSAGLPASDRRGVRRAPPGPGRRSASTRCCEATRAPCWHVTSTRGRGCSTRSRTWTPATRTGCPPRWNAPRSGNGGHVWIFFDGPVAAADARSLGAALLRQAMSTRAELDLTSYDRFFPSQDYLPKAGFGNLIALPLQGECAVRGNTLFLDPTTLDPWPDQWAFLSSVARLSRDAVAELAAIPPPGRCRTGPQPRGAGPSRRAASSAGDPGPTRGDVLDRAGRYASRGHGGTEASRVDRQPRVLREAADAVLDVEHTAVHLLLRRGPRMAAPSPRAHRAGHRSSRRSRKPVRPHR